MLVKMCIMALVYEYVLQFMQRRKTAANMWQKSRITMRMGQLMFVYVQSLSFIAMNCLFRHDLVGPKERVAAVLLMGIGLNSYLIKAREKNISHKGE